jgi:hypothetical protein
VQPRLDGKLGIVNGPEKFRILHRIAAVIVTIAGALCGSHGATDLDDQALVSARWMDASQRKRGFHHEKELEMTLEKVYALQAKLGLIKYRCCSVGKY